MKALTLLLCLFLTNFQDLCAQSCGGQMTNRRGDLSSPRYPNNYPDNSQCTWTIRSTGRRTVSLTFNSVSLETCCDYIKVYDGPSTHHPLLGEIREYRSQSFKSSSNDLTVYFYSDHSSTSKGFHANWVFVDSNSCRNNCGYSLSSCSCDYSCQYYSNCCSDYSYYCSSTTSLPQTTTDSISCRNNCGYSRGSCSCDYSCQYYGNCCSDYSYYCSSSTNWPQPTTEIFTGSWITDSISCRNNCGYSRGSCSCDYSCQYYSNCCSDYSYYCSSTTISPQPTKEHVNCSSDNMTIVIQRSYLNSVGLSGSDLYVNDRLCRPTISSTEVMFRFPLNACGTVKEMMNSNVSYTNNVRASQSQSGQITRQSQFLLRVGCRMEPDTMVQIFYKAQENINANITEMGHFGANIAFYSSSNFDRKIYDSPFEVNLNQLLYVQVALNRPDNSLDLFLDTCVASPNPNDFKDRSYDLLRNGCPRDNTYYSYTSGQHYYARFSFQAFKFLRNHAYVYLQCKVIICPDNYYNSRCHQGCRFRRKRSLDSTYHTNTVMLGPIKLKDGWLYSTEGTSEPCGGYMTDAMGELFSPRYPNNYPNNAQCIWTIHSTGNTTVSLTITDLDLETCCDYIRVYDGPSTLHPLLGEIKEYMNQTFNSTYSDLTVFFYSDSSVTSRGFHANWVFVASCDGNCGLFLGSCACDAVCHRFGDCCPDYDGYCTVSTTSEAPSDDPCYSYTVLDEPWRATDYQNDSVLMCDRDVNWFGWYRLFIHGQSAQMPNTCIDEYKCGTHAPLWLNGEHPKVEDGVVTRGVCAHWNNNCCYYNSTPIRVKACPGDYYVYEYVWPSSCDLAYCADVSNINTTYTTVAPETISFVPHPECGGHLYGSGLFSSPNYPNSYHDNAYCVWYLSAQQGQRIFLTFADLQLERCCNCDYITVYDGHSTDHPQLGKICFNETTHQVFHSSSRYLTVVFRSDYSGVSHCFKALFTSSLTADQGRVDCSSDNMVIAIQRSYLNSLGLNADDLYVDDHLCRPSISSNEVVFSFPLDACGTVKETMNGYVSYTNNVRGSQSQSGEISHQSQFLLRVGCRMEPDTMVQIFYKANENINANITGTGRFNASIAFYTSSSFYQKIYDSPYEVNLNQLLYVQVELNRPENSLDLFLDTCVASPNPNDFKDRSYDLLRNGCPRDNTYYSYTSDQHYYARFSFRAFKFLRTYAYVYLQCKVIICPDNDYNSRCRQGCHFRRKRSLDSTYHNNTVMLGPIKLKGQRHNVKDSENSKE